MEIRLLTDPGSLLLPVLCGWMYDWWCMREGYSYGEVACMMRHSLCADRLPMTLVAVEDGKPIGMCQLSMHDLDAYPDLYPWLMNVYVPEDCRGRGISGLMLEAVEVQARRLGIDHMFLFTKMVGFYERFGWEYMRDIDTYRAASPVERLYVRRYGGGFDGEWRP